MLTARTIGGVIMLAAGALVLVGVRTARHAAPTRLASLAHSGRIVGAFLLVWLLRDVAELLLTRMPVHSFAHTVDLVCIALSSALTGMLLFASRVSANAWLRAGLAILATLTAASSLVRILS